MPAIAERLDSARHHAYAGLVVLDFWLFWDFSGWRR